MFFVAHWALGSVPLLRRAGWPRAARWVLALLMALAGGGLVHLAA